MAFSYIIVEDGSALDNANSYVGIGYANSYHTRRGNSDWFNKDVQEQEIALMNATRAVDVKYGLAYMGDIKTSIQSLLFPRTIFTDGHGREIDGTIPLCLLDAVCEYALLDVNGTDLFVDPNRAEAGVQSQSSSVGGGAVSESVTYFAPTVSVTYQTGTRLLSPILKSSAFQGTAIRG